MVTAEGTAREFPVASLPVTLGRGEEAKVRIPLASVSRRHCELLLDDDDELIVKDLGSSNGTLVNGTRVKSRELIPGDILTVGPVVFVVKIDGHPKDIDPAAAYATGVAGQTPSGSHPAVAGVPTWAGAAPASTPASSPSPSGPDSAAKPASAKPAAPAAKPKSKDDDLDSILGDLSESDFDIDFSDLDDGPKKK